MNVFIKYFVMLLFSLTIFSSARSQNWPTITGDQNNDPTFDKSSVWHKNMELIQPLNLSAPFEGEQFSTGYIKFKNSSNVDEKGQFVIVATRQHDFRGDPTLIEPALTNVAALNAAYYIGPSRIQVFDVTNPRNPSIALEIMLKKGPSLNISDDTTFSVRETYHTFKNTSIWIDDDGHTFLAANVNEFKRIHEGVLVKTSPTIYSRVLIIDLTAALTHVKASGATSNVIIISDATDRNSAYVRGTSSITFDDVYIGYIPRDDEHFTMAWDKELVGEVYYKKATQRTQNHTMTCDPMSSVLSINPLYYSTTCDINPTTGDFSNEEYHAYVDLYLMNSIPLHIDFSSNSNFVTPTRITTNGNVPICVDVVLGSDRYVTRPHEAHAHKMKVMEPRTDGTNNWEIPHATDFHEHMIMLNVASFGSSKESIDNMGENKPLGGGVIFKIEWDMNDEGNAVVEQKQYWGYSDDRENPNDKFTTGYTANSKDVDWTPIKTHTLGSFHINLWTHLFLTANEMDNTDIGLWENGTTLESIHPTDDVTVNAESASGGLKGYVHTNKYNTQWGSYESTPFVDNYVVDDRRIGNYMKVWGAKLHQSILGVGNDDADGGPIGSYDTHEIMPGDYNINGRNAALENNQIVDLKGILNSSSSAVQPGISGAHHFNSIYGITGQYFDDSGMDYKINRELFVANYTAGARVLDFKEFLKPEITDYSTYVSSITFSPKIIHERAYFDFFPTLTYNKEDRYFYLLKNYIGQSGSPEREDYFRDQLFNLVNYYNGFIDVLPDTRKYLSTPGTGLEVDEEFVYAMGASGKQAPWLKNGGFLVLRYFRDSIGGTISGYDGSGGDMAFREVNLQGDFKITRDLNIAEDAVVTLMPGKENEPGIFSSSSIHRNGGGSGFINVYGTLNISLPAGDNDGTSIVLDATRIQVMDGGKLVFHKIRDDKSQPIIVKSRIIVAGGGTLEVKEGAYVAFNQHLDIYGGFKSLGTSNEPVMLVGNLNPSTNRKPDFENFWYDQIRITIDGYDKLPEEGNYEMRYSTFKNLPISIRNSTLNNGYSVDNCTFLDSTRISVGTIPGLSTSLVFLSTGKDSRPLESKKTTWFTNCKFADVGDISSMTKHVQNANRKNGLSAINFKIISIINCEFDELLRGASFENVSMGSITGSNFTNCKAGSVITSSNMKLCDNDYEDCVIGASYTTTSSSTTIFDNDFVTTQVGIGLYHSGEYWLKGNTLNYYCNGVGVWGRSYAILAPKSSDKACPIPPYGDQWYYLGRNHFDYPSSPSEVTKFNMYNYSHDIAIHDNLSDVYLRCGFNKFAISSDKHIHNNSSTFKYIDGSNNEFRPSPSYIPRVNTSFISVSGDNKDVSEDPNLSCFNTLTCLDLCNPVPAFGGGPGGDDCEPFCAIKIRRFDFDTNATNSTVLLHYSDSKLSMLDTSISEYKRIEYAKQAFYTVIILDSNTIYVDTLLTDLNTIINDTLYTTLEKSNASFLKGMIFESRFELDSAFSVYSSIINQNYSVQDSLNAHWKLLKLAAESYLDTIYVPEYDSLMAIYYVIMTDDLLLSSSNPNMKQGIHDIETEDDNVSSKSSIEYIKANPVISNSELRYIIMEECEVSLDIRDERGLLVANLVNSFHNPGTYDIKIDAKDMISGTYFATLKACDQVVTLKFVVIK